MHITGTLIDHNGTLHTISDLIGFPKLIKHAVLAGLGPGFAYPAMIASWIGLSLFTGMRFRLKSNYVERFHPIYDPDEISMMSRMIGRSLADIYAKSHYGADFTICYEHCCKWIGLPIQGPRPDFLSIDWASMQAFSIEAKGFSKTSISSAEFAEHKLQSISADPAFGTSFGVASVTYGIYSQIKVQIEDPPTGGTNFDPEIMELLIQSYYDEVRVRLADFRETQDALFEPPLSIEAYDYFQIGELLNPTHPNPIYLLVPKARPGNANSRSGPIDAESIYIDKDGIGVWFAPNNSFKPMSLRGTD